MDGESDPAWRSQRTYPNRGTHPNVMFSAQQPQPLLLNHIKHQSRKHETYLPRLSGTKQRMDPAPDWQQFEPTSTCMPWSSSMDHNSKRYMRLPKNTPRVAKAMTNPSNTEPSHKNFPLCHHNSRQSCCTVCPRCLTRGRLPKSPSAWTQEANGCPKWENCSLQTGTFSTQGILTPLCRPLKSKMPWTQWRMSSLTLSYE